MDPKVKSISKVTTTSLKDHDTIGIQVNYGVYIVVVMAGEAVDTSQPCMGQQAACLTILLKKAGKGTW
jgi:hypothetical protein